MALKITPVRSIRDPTHHAALAGCWQVGPDGSPAIRWFDPRTRPMPLHADRIDGREVVWPICGKTAFFPVDP
jgi:hypothetical protein